MDLSIRTDTDPFKTAGWIVQGVEKGYASLYLIHTMIASFWVPMLEKPKPKPKGLVKDLLPEGAKAQLIMFVSVGLPKLALESVSRAFWQVLFMRYVVCAQLEEINPDACLADGMSWMAVYLGSAMRFIGFNVFFGVATWLIYTGIRVGYFGKLAAEFLDTI
jgi:hypothetical protein